MAERGGFPATRHSLLDAARGPDAQERARALALLAAAYWQPAYRYLRLRWRRDHEDACDLTQEFFARLVEKDLLARFDPGRARLRTYLRLCLDGLHKNAATAAARRKRGGGAHQVSFDFPAARDALERELRSKEPSPEERFERDWVKSVLALALERFRSEARAGGRTVDVELFLLYDLPAEDVRPSYAELAARFGIKTTDVTNRLAAARRAFRRAALDVLRELTVSEAEFRAEARALLGQDAS